VTASSSARCLILGLTFCAACSGRPAANAKASAGAANVAPVPDAHAAATENSPRTVIGPVLETMDASSYTYVRVKTDAGDLWAAASQFKVAVGDRVVVSLEQPMQDFHSQSLNRDFPVIYFVPRIAHEGETAPADSPGAPGMPTMVAAHSSGPAAPAAPVTEAMAPPPGATTVADVWANHKALAGKTVTVRGKVVKYNGGILGRNWIHVQDGTGTAAAGSNDITITTTAETKVGDVITATGTVAVDKDFGAGYTYAVMLENAGVTMK
jgi:hypothetical protein